MQVVIFHRHVYRAAVFGQRTKQHIFSKLALDALLYESLHGASAHFIIVAFAYQPIPRVFVHVEGDLLGVELRLQFGEELVCDDFDDFFWQRMKLVVPGDEK